jgi:hypothetical protein
MQKSKQQQKMLVEFLRKKQQQMEKNVIEGTQPVFGFPLVCYNEYDGTLRDKEIFVQELVSHVFNPLKTSVPVLLEAHKKHQRLYSDM